MTVLGKWPLGEPGSGLLFLAPTVRIHVTLRLGRWEEGGVGGREKSKRERGGLNFQPGSAFHTFLSPSCERMFGERGARRGRL